MATYSRAQLQDGFHREKKHLAPTVLPVSRESSIARTLTPDHRKSLPDPPRSFGGRWRVFWVRPFLNTWLAELLALAFSAGCLIAIVVVLKVYESKTRPQLPYGLTLNALISILAAGSKSSLLLAVAGAISQLKWSWFAGKKHKLEDMQEFDDASRGPWGSVTLLFSINVRSLASIGALITLLTLAYDPFVQQVVKYPVRDVQQHSDEAVTMQADIMNPDTNTPEFGNALYNGVWSDDAAFARNPACPSGNCDWPTFRSMGWCSKCENVTSRVVVDDCPFERFYNDKMKSLQCNLTFDENPGIRYAWGNTGADGSQDLTILSQAAWPVWTSTNDTGPTVLDVENPAMVYGFVSLYYLTPECSVTTDEGCRIKASVQHAEQCVLTPCARTYSISTRNGELHEKVVDEDYGLQKTYTVPQKNNAMSPFATQELFCWQPDPGNLTMHYIEPTGPTGARSGLYNPWIPSVAERWANLSGHAFCALDDYQLKINTALNGSATMDAAGLIPGEGQAVFWEWLHKYPYSENGWVEYSTSALQKMTTTNLTTVVNGVAASLTKLGLDLSNVTVHGNVTTSEVYVQAEWKWLIFPIALEAFGILLLALTMIMSRMEKTRLWKSSVLPLLYHGLSENGPRVRAPPQDIFGMEELARNTSVRLGGSTSDNRVVLGP